MPLWIQDDNFPAPSGKLKCKIILSYHAFLVALEKALALSLSVSLSRVISLRLLEILNDNEIFTVSMD